MPNGSRQRAEHEAERIEAVTAEGWEHLSDPPSWVVEAAKRERLHKTSAKHQLFHGDTYVYRAEGSVHNVGLNVFRQLKSDYFETTRHEGTCPNCQAYVERQKSDRFLTCHRCGWTVGLPLLRWITYPSWIDYYFGE